MSTEIVAASPRVRRDPTAHRAMLRPSAPKLQRSPHHVRSQCVGTPTLTTLCFAPVRRDPETHRTKLGPNPSQPQPSPNQARPQPIATPTLTEPTSAPTDRNLETPKPNLPHTRRNLDAHPLLLPQRRPRGHGRRRPNPTFRSGRANSGTISQSLKRAPCASIAPRFECLAEPGRNWPKDHFEVTPPR